MYAEIYKIVYVDNLGKHEDKIMAQDWAQLFNYVSKHYDKYSVVMEIKLITSGCIESAF